MNTTSTFFKLRIWLPLLIAAMLIGAGIKYTFQKNIEIPAKIQEQFNKATYNESIESVEAWLKAHPQDANAKELLGALYIQKGTFDTQSSQYLEKAIQTLTEVLLLEKNRSESYRLIGSAYMYKNDLENAEKNFKKAVTISNDSNLEARAGLAKLFEIKNEWNKALSAYTYILSIDENNESANLGSARYFIQDKKAVRAREYAQKVLSNSKNNANLGEAFHIIGSALLLQGENVAARENFLEALKLVPNKIHSMTLLGESVFNNYLRIEQTKREAARIEMREIANKILTLKPDYIYAYALLYKVAILDQNLPEANTIGQKIVSLLDKDIILTDAQKKQYREYYSQTITSISLKKATFTESEKKQ